jgi:hypothetical protein
MPMVLMPNCFQLDAFDAMRNRVPSTASDVWTRIADGVDGKSPAECQALWDSKWSSPPAASNSRQQQLSSSFASGSVKSSAVASTPEIASQIAGAGPGHQKTAVFKSNMRRIAGAVSRDIDDDDLEPVLGGENRRLGGGARSRKAVDDSKVDNASTKNGVIDGHGDGDEEENNEDDDVAFAPLPFAVQLSRGTPDTAAKLKRAAAQRAGEVQTPEILARGRSFGLKEADQYVSTFARRVAENASKKRVTGADGRKSWKKNGEGESGSSVAKVSSQPIDDLPAGEAQALADDDESSEDFDLFF